VRAGLNESSLRCPADRPEDEGTFERMIREGQGRARLRMNCSGKHAAMLLACSVNGWSTNDYLSPSHPLQQQVQKTMADMTGVSSRQIAVDGCGAPLFGTTVRGVAASFRALVIAEPESAAGRVARAMRENPFYVGGSGHANSELMINMPGALSKGGAEGVIGVATSDGAAVSMKIVDGSPRATTVIALAVLESLGYDTDAAARFAQVFVMGGGKAVGQIEIGSGLRQSIASRKA
jgi:L-asparaginase II